MEWNNQIKITAVCVLVLDVRSVTYEDLFSGKTFNGNEIKERLIEDAWPWRAGVSLSNMATNVTLVWQT